MGVKHVLKFSYLSYILFLILAVIIFSFKQWKKLLWLLFTIIISYLIAMILAVYGNVFTKLEIIKFLIILTIFSLAICILIASIDSFKNTDKYVFLHVALFAFLNGLGSSGDLLLKLDRN
ncbi:HupE/UreJ family protein [uncultured Polaribacter sp.]|uniref:HupE/UreJ family protein n=1 Tax=uncultured Polaribacter sp. TaxID=174711 RepID=UPI002624C3BE|nr:HupE/UreJ family protein [uncultured Polaribacter sp.]